MNLSDFYLKKKRSNQTLFNIKSVYQRDYLFYLLWNRKWFRSMTLSSHFISPEIWCKCKLLPVKNVTRFRAWGRFLGQILWADGPSIYYVRIILDFFWPTHSNQHKYSTERQKNWQFSRPTQSFADVIYGWSLATPDSMG